MTWLDYALAVILLAALIGCLVAIARGDVEL